MTPPSRPLRILLVPALTEASGASLLAARVARRLDPARFECRMILPSPGEFAERLRAEGLRVDTLTLRGTRWRDAGGPRGKLQWLISRFAYGKDLDRLMGRYRPDIAYVHSVIQPLPGLVARRRGVPLVWHVHETLDAGHPGARRQRACVRRLAQTAIFCGWASRRSFGRPPPGRRWVVIPNGVPVEIGPARRSAIRAEMRKELNIDDAEFVMIAVGRVRPGKGLDLLAEALGRCRTFRAPEARFRLLVAGETGGNENLFHRRVLEILARSGVSGRVIFLGHREDVPRCLAAADVFVSPSRAEAFPLSLLEAFAAGIPAVVTNVGDCRLLVGEPRRGLCVAPENAEALAEALDRLHGEPASREIMGRNARRLVESRFSEEVFLDRVGRELDRAAGRFPRREACQ